MSPAEIRCPATHPDLPAVHCARAAGHSGNHCNAIGKSGYGDDFLPGSTVWAAVETDAEIRAALKTEMGYALQRAIEPLRAGLAEFQTQLEAFRIVIDEQWRIDAESEGQ